jgi:hypothetical protein
MRNEDPYRNGGLYPRLQWSSEKEINLEDFSPVHLNE